ncbi:unannotated protein [freshwater metagenome]|uniref:Unannotated protein n=1 Tax=freshwater metagenome TaxID=449393 RepID=A0A6J7S6E7_9ZZZZ
MIDEVVEVRNQIAERTAAVTEGNAAIHAPCTLLSELAVGPRLDKLLVRLKLDPFDRIFVGKPYALNLEEAADLPHHRPTSLASTLGWSAFSRSCCASSASTRL